MNIEKYPVKLKLGKSGDMIYFSQLDLVRILERALRRTDLPLYFSQGFSPRVKMSFHGGLKLGVEGQIDLTLYFCETVSADMVIEKLSSQLPEGLSLF